MHGQFGRARCPGRGLRISFEAVATSSSRGKNQKIPTFWRMRCSNSFRPNDRCTGFSCDTSSGGLRISSCSSFRRASQTRPKQQRLLWTCCSLPTDFESLCRHGPHRTPPYQSRPSRAPRVSWTRNHMVRTKRQHRPSR
ncbi:hypothetical protein ATCV1_z455L [Acanthocystis turfacea chlorella virus 1]|uniref:Uncharacterized protein z455L n=1 Tax=Chlorovirus heliozoae TaxID=322019 RepID=A7K965_9PHYC|nr:hypothetical protein ATCV1_z455L [Acanthocystis turfacea chlorella virus 1]ABT16589.1 hypothetical protein ATCV1_z455L [Acanthocystis turfacea chlorella virus 1]